MKEETVFSVLQQLRKLNSSASFKWVPTHFEPSKNPSLQVPSTAFKKEHWNVNDEQASGKGVHADQPKDNLLTIFFKVRERARFCCQLTMWQCRGQEFFIFRLQMLQWNLPSLISLQAEGPLSDTSILAVTKALEVKHLSLSLCEISICLDFLTMFHAWVSSDAVQVQRGKRSLLKEELFCWVLLQMEFLALFAACKSQSFWELMMSR